MLHQYVNNDKEAIGFESFSWATVNFASVINSISLTPLFFEKIFLKLDIRKDVYSRPQGCNEILK